MEILFNVEGIRQILNRFIIQFHRIVFNEKIIINLI